MFDVTNTRTTLTVTPGRYFLGDPCYAVTRQNDWVALLESCRYFEEPVGTLNGTQVAAFGTAYGDGFYQDRDGYGYPVDAGLIGLTPVGLIDDETALTGLGRFVEFEEPVSMSGDYGLIACGPYRIDTR